MMDLGANIAIGFLTNTVYDIVKFAESKFWGRLRFKEKGLRELVESSIFESFPDELSNLFDSSTFVQYFDSPQYIIKSL